MKFRVLSDLHVDVNKHYPLDVPESGRGVFTVLCGDTSGGPETTVDWVKKNVRRGVLVSGNHLPYCNYYGLPASKKRTMDELRRVMAGAFPADGDITYLDVETGFFKKVVDGVMFLGSCCYTDMRIRHDVWNPSGDPALNCSCSEYNMNDYQYGYTGREWPFGPDNDPSMIRMKASDYMKWAGDAKAAFTAALDENESSASPLPAVLVTHHPVVPQFLTRSYYVDDCSALWSRRGFNWASYASDWTDWLKGHPSVKCCCCGHIHDVVKEWRHFDLDLGGRSVLVVNNARGYVAMGHDYNFNMNTFVDTATWTASEDPLPADEAERRRKASAQALAYASAWM